MSSLASFARNAAFALGFIAIAPATFGAEPAPADKPKRVSKLGECSHAAKEKGLKGDDRKASIKECMAAAKAAKESKAKPVA